MYSLSIFNPKFSALYFKKPTSKSALCATSFRSPIKFKNLGITLSMVSASFTMSSVIFVISVILYGIGISGFTKHSNVSIISLFLTLTAPISVIFSVLKESPVVSISKTIYSLSIPFDKSTALSSGTKYASTPYITFIPKSSAACFASGKACTTPWSVIAIDFIPQDAALFIKSVAEETPSIWLICVCKCNSTLFLLALSILFASISSGTSTITFAITPSSLA